MTAEFNLSEKIIQNKGFYSERGILVVEDVREFIRLLKESIYRNSDSYVDNMKVLKVEYLNRIINKLAGEKLKGDSND